MNRISMVIAVLPLALFALGGDASAAGKLSKVEKLTYCEATYASCGHDCENLIDIGSTVADCHKRCDQSYNRCKKWARTMEVLPPDKNNDLRTVAP